MAITMRKLKILVLAVLLAFFFAIGCDQDLSESETYPCKYVVYSDLDNDAAITSCEGIGSAYPDGFVRRNSLRSPTSVFFFPRQRSFPKSFRIKCYGPNCCRSFGRILTVENSDPFQGCWPSC